MKVVILAGGFGTRLSEFTDKIPKPMVDIDGIPMIEHIMRHYSNFGFNDFILCLGYKQNVIKEYFLNYKLKNSDIELDLGTGEYNYIKEDKRDWKINLVNTGLETLTGGRVKKIKELIKEERFLLTYGDGLSNVNINNLIDFHISKKKSITLSAVRPQARFGELEIIDGCLQDFKEKPQLREGRINGGFFVVEKRFINYIEKFDEMLEVEPIKRAILNSDVAAYETDAFWRCVDSKRDLDYVRSLCRTGKAPWII